MDITLDDKEMDTYGAVDSKNLDRISSIEATTIFQQ